MSATKPKSVEIESDLPNNVRDQEHEHAKYKTHKAPPGMIKCENHPNDDYAIVAGDLLLYKMNGSLVRYSMNAEDWVDFQGANRCTHPVYNSDTNKLYLFKKSTWETLKINTKKYTRSTKINQELPSFRGIHSVHIPSPFNQIHFIDLKTKHMIVDIESRQLNILQVIDEDVLDDFYGDMNRLVFVSALQKMLLFYCDSNRDHKIKYCDITDKDYKWLDLDIKIPFHSLPKGYDVILVHDYVLLVFLYPDSSAAYPDHESTDDEPEIIWALDLLSNGWHKSQYILPKIVAGTCRGTMSGERLYTKCVKLAENIHFMEVETYTEYGDHVYVYSTPYHISIKWRDVTPINDIIKRYQLLICGYIGHVTVQPDDVLKMLLNYFFNDNS